MIFGRHVFIGYHGMEEETKTVKNSKGKTVKDSEGKTVKDSEGWLHTGDSGHLDVVSTF